MKERERKEKGNKGLNFNSKKIHAQISAIKRAVFNKKASNFASNLNFNIN